MIINQKQIKINHIKIYYSYPKIFHTFHSQFLQIIENDQ